MTAPHETDLLFLQGTVFRKPIFDATVGQRLIFAQEPAYQSGSTGPLRIRYESGQGPDIFIPQGKRKSRVPAAVLIGERNNIDRKVRYRRPLNEEKPAIEHALGLVVSHARQVSNWKYDVNGSNPTGADILAIEQALQGIRKSFSSE